MTTIPSVQTGPATEVEVPAADAAVEEPEGSDGPLGAGRPADAPGDLPAFGDGSPAHGARPLSTLSEVEMSVSVELGRTSLPVRALLALQTGAVVQLDQPVGTPANIFVNGTHIGSGEIVVVDGDYGVRVTSLLGEG